MIQLRDYQQTAVENVRNAFKAHRRVLLVMATGAGKTVTFSYICNGAQARGNNVLILAHRQELLDQISAALQQFGVRHGFIAAGYPERKAMVQVGSTQTVIRRLQSIHPPRLIIIDEAHHATKKNTLGYEVIE
jgi:superfamily II DNA or RNA helicase